MLGRDLSFYIFQLPFLERLQTLAGLLVFWVALLVTAAYVATGAIRVADTSLSASPLARRHLSALLGAFLVVIAIDAWLDRYNVLLSGSGIGNAPGYSDVHAVLPGKVVIALLALLTAGAVVYGGWRGQRRAPIAAGALLLAGFVGAQLVYPALVQKLTVEPNEFPRERPFVEQHLTLTRLAFGLADLERALYPYRPPADLEEERVRSVLTGVPLWDERPLLQAYNQRQSLFPYYEFVSAHQDRYGPPGDARQVALSVRELEPTKLPETAQTWQNLHLTYVNGVGVVVGPVSSMAADGAPLYYVSDLDPPKLAPGAPDALQITRPEVYFGERTRGYVILDEAEGPVGVPLDRGWKKLVFAWAFQSRNLFLSDETTGSSRIAYRRQVVERAQAIAPFLRFTADTPALPVVENGRIVWILDGYTGSAYFPVARQTSFEGRPVSYLRNSAKVTVDGVTGEVAVYAVDPEDPMLRTYSRIFPGLVRPVEEMAPELRRHLRVPRSILRLQTQVLEEYHMLDARAFYAGEDVWALATENYRSEAVPVEPTYSMFPLPGSEEREFLLTVPFVSRGRQNMTALLVTRNDPPHYGEQILLELPRDVLVPGPQQIEAMIDQDPEISQQLSLWRQGGSDVVRGHLISVPHDSTILYVEPLYLVSESAAIPQLERVILSTGSEVVMSPTLEGAVSALLGTAPDSGAAEEESPDTPRTPQPEGPDASEVIGRARRLLEQAESQLRSGDWAAFGRTWEAIRALLEGASTAAAPRP